MSIGNAEWMYGHRSRPAARWLIQMLTLPREIWKVKAAKVGKKDCQCHC